MQDQTLAQSAVAAGDRVWSDGYAPGVSWGAVFAGAAAAAALSFILLILGAGLGLSSVSPYGDQHRSVTPAAIGWIIFTQLLASGIGGYLAGRLRVKWASVHGDEVHFRDTAHGLLAWATATLAMVAITAGGAGALMGAVADAGTAAAGITAGMAGTPGAGMPGQGGAGGQAELSPLRGPATYFSDMLLRSDSGDEISEAQRTEVNTILATSVAAGKLAPDDRGYLATLVADRTGLAQADAERRVDDVYGRARQAAAQAKAKAQAAAESARQAGARAALWMFVALLAGAYLASLMATIGGRRRDNARVLLQSTH